MFLLRNYANTRSTKGLSVSVALHENQPTPARLVVVVMRRKLFALLCFTFKSERNLGLPY